MLSTTFDTVYWSIFSDFLKKFPSLFPPLLASFQYWKVHAFLDICEHLCSRRQELSQYIKIAELLASFRSLHGFKSPVKLFDKLISPIWANKSSSNIFHAERNFCQLKRDTYEVPNLTSFFIWGFKLRRTNNGITPSTTFLSPSMKSSSEDHLWWNSQA